MELVWLVSKDTSCLEILVCSYQIIVSVLIKLEDACNVKIPLYFSMAFVFWMLQTVLSTVQLQEIVWIVFKVTTLLEIIVLYSLNTAKMFLTQESALPAFMATSSLEITLVYYLLLIVSKHRQLLVFAYNAYLVIILL